MPANRNDLPKQVFNTSLLQSTDKNLRPQFDCLNNSSYFKSGLKNVINKNDALKHLLCHIQFQ